MHHQQNCNRQIAKLMSQCNEKAFELEIKSADNRILQEQPQAKESENNELQETILLLRQQLTMSSERSIQQKNDCTNDFTDRHIDGDIARVESNTEELQRQILMQAADVEKLKQENVRVNDKMVACKFKVRNLQKKHYMQRS